MQVSICPSIHFFICHLSIFYDYEMPWQDVDICMLLFFFLSVYVMHVMNGMISVTLAASIA